MEAAIPIAMVGALLGTLVGFIGPVRWPWQLLRLAPLLVLPGALYILQHTSWILGGGGPWVNAALLALIGAAGYLPSVLAVAVLRWAIWRRG
ncbi:hypothetical protein [Stenotrophomonas sp. YAU14D1_LEIMI4_1]|uniref:hypothetical protein n=1 Tax=Stenotrophomonas sp. YAU14D1_LEIMI4_1 TaxID=2072407 RepID=UPI000D53C909|nr:hypothetical protein [Stenotrophomonas sp. YAU14D1_LEIMI4_1]AWH25647.1 hypothetical protein C1932_11400 [Stenotrophomonas sp. YAU14D1_LEIMI4_1]